ncbi:MAG: DUF1269 domain-containing protein [Actinobacteria bacterium]|nr:DUF1269 domain-containing protein [Actinomycetota bacterium]
MPELVAITFEDETGADRAAEELGRCREELLVDPDASAVLVCERDDSCRLTTRRRADATSQWCEFWGAMLDALPSSADPMAMELRFRKRLLAQLRPGSSALLLVAPDGGRERAVEALSHFGGRALSHRLEGAISPRSYEARAATRT